MKAIATDKNKITLIYNSNTSLGKQLKAYVHVSKKKVLELDISKSPLTATQWASIADQLNTQMKDLINKNHPDYLNNYEKNLKMNSNDWVKILRNSPEVIHGSIVIVGEQYHHLINPSDFKKLIEADSAGVSRNPDT